jgi:hypothetical protein
MCFRVGNKILLIGCDDSLEHKIRSAFLLQPHEQDDSMHYSLDFTCITSEQFTESKQLPPFHLIIINQASLKAPFQELKKLFTQALNLLSPDEASSVLINGMLPAFENNRKNEDWVNHNAYHLIIHMRSLRNFDAALGNFEGGLLLVYPRRNPYRITQKDLDELNVSYADLRKNMDKVVPVLSFSEMHDWLSNETHTRRFVRCLDEIKEKRT